MRTAPLSAALVAAILALGAPALHAEVSPQSIVDTLNAAGYGSVELTTGPTQVRAEATNGSERIEVVYDRATGAILSQETRREGSRAEVRAGAEMHTSTQDFDTPGSDDPSVGGDDSSDDDHGGATGGSDDSGADDHGGATGGSDDSGADDHGGGAGGSDDGGSGHDGGNGSDD